MHFSRHASVLALALAACGGTAPQAPANESSRSATSAAPGAAGQKDAYAACQARANGDASALTGCADTAIAAAGRGIDSPEAAVAFRTALQELGDRAAEAGGAAARVTFAQAAVQAARQRAVLLSGTAQSVSRLAAPASASGAWVKSRMLSCREHPVSRCAARYDALLPLLAPAPAPAKDPAMTTTAPAEGLPLPTCDALQADGKVGAALADAFYARYPRSLAGERSVEQVALDPAALDNVIRYLVCVAGATEYDPVVAENGLALFASKRHGAAARHALSALAGSSDPAAGAARRFNAQIAGYLRHPG